MRDREEIEREIEERRQDVVEGIRELEDVVRDKVQAIKDKVDVRKRAREAIEHGKESARIVAHKIEETARERPLLLFAATAGLLAVGTIAFKVVRRRRRRVELRAD